MTAAEKVHSKSTVKSTDLQIHRRSEQLERSTAEKVEVRFNLWSTLGIQYSTTSTPVAIGTYLSVSVGVGGSPVFFWGYIIGIFMSSFICMSLAEMASSHPHASGKFHSDMWKRDDN